MSEPLFFPFQNSKGNDYFFEGRSFKIFEGDSHDNINPQEIPLQKSKPYPRTISLTLTNNCNMGCKYCYAGQGDWDNPGYQMSFDIAKKAVDLLIEVIQTSKGNFGTFSFFGGEPLLKFDLIKKIVDYANQKAGNKISLRFALVTNGTLLDEEKLEYLINNKFVISLSLDGSQVQHDKCRIYKNGGGTYDDIIKNLNGKIDQLPILVRPTISIHNYLVDKAVKALVSKGFKSIAYVPDYNLNENLIEEYIEANDRLYRFYLNEIRNKRYFDLRNITTPLMSILTKKRKASHCNAEVSYLSCSAEGTIYTCHRFIGEKAFARGNVSSITADELIENSKIFRKSLKEGSCDRNSKCKNCPFTYLCGGLCYHDSFLNDGKIFSPYELGCKFKKQSYTNALRLITELQGKELKEYLNFLKSLWEKEDRTHDLYFS